MKFLGGYDAATFLALNFDFVVDNKFFINLGLDGWHKDFKERSKDIAWGSLYGEFMPEIEKLLTTDFFVESDRLKAMTILSCLANRVPMLLRPKAKEIYTIKNSERGNLWEDLGLVGSLVEIHAKLARLKLNPTDEDSFVDLYNYCVIGIMCLVSDLFKVKAVIPKKALVTGCGTGGLADELANTMEMNGMKVFRIKNKDDGVDKLQEKAVAAFFKELSRGIKFDYVVNVYGRNHLNWIGDLEQEDYNLMGCNVNVPLAVIDELVKRDNPCKILNIASQTYRVAQRCTAAYCASKAAVVQMTKVAARELAGKGYVINALAPGKIEGTQMSEKTDAQVNHLRGWSKESADKYSASNIPAQRNTTKEEVTLAVLKILALPDYINGSVIDMTGGQ